MTTTDHNPNLPTLRNLTDLSLSIAHFDPSTSVITGRRSSRSRLHTLINPDQPDLEVTFRLPNRRRWLRNAGAWEEVVLRVQRIESESGSKSVGDEQVPLLEKPSRSRPSDDLLLPFRAYAKTLNDNRTTLLILPRVDPSTYLSDMSDNTSIADLMLPGTHESMARYGWPISQCQHPSSTLLAQLTQGIRYFDIRLRLKPSGLVCYHGAWPQLTTFPSILRDISSFLSSHPRETLILCVQQETSAHPGFSRKVREDMQPYIEAGEWFLHPRVPELGEVRGRGILMSRFGGGSGPTGSGPWEVPVEGRGAGGEMAVRMGWRPNRWPDSELEGFTWDCGETTVATQDWYDIYGAFNIPAKFSILTDHLRSTSHLPPQTNLTLSFSSAGSIPLALPPVVAKGFGWPAWGLGWRGMNELLRGWLLDRLAVEGEESGGWKESSRTNGDHKTKPQPGPERARLVRGIVPMDYYDSGGVVDVMLVYNVIRGRGN